jgi:hypothetical protein
MFHKKPQPGVDLEDYIAFFYSPTIETWKGTSFASECVIRSHGPKCGRGLLGSGLLLCAGKAKSMGSDTEVIMSSLKLVKYVMTTCVLYLSWYETKVIWFYMISDQRL